MAFKDFTEQRQSVTLLQRSLARGRLGHAYLFTGNRLEELEALARTLGKTLNCQQPVLTEGLATDSCDACPQCRRVASDTHPDVHWVRPESKSRVVTIDQMRELIREVQLKPTEATVKVGIVVAADRLNAQAANAFLKTLEEPPAKSVLILLSSEPQRLLETILSRCLRLNFSGPGEPKLDAAKQEWLVRFGSAALEQKSLLSRYRLLDELIGKLSEIKAQIESDLREKSPLERYEDVEKDLREKWEDELTAAVEAEYRRQRAEWLGALQCWLRDVWLRTLTTGDDLLQLPQMSSTEQVAQRLSPAVAMENIRVFERTQRRLHTNVQEALALEVGLLELRL